MAYLSKVYVRDGTVMNPSKSLCGGEITYYHRIIFICY